MGISGLSLSVITWPAAHVAEKQTGAVYAMGHSQGKPAEVVCLYNVLYVCRGLSASELCYVSSMAYLFPSLCCGWEVKRTEAPYMHRKQKKEKDLDISGVFSCGNEAGWYGWHCAAMFQAFSSHIVLPLIPVGSVI